jgi:6-phosphogluconolactonase
MFAYVGSFTTAQRKARGDGIHVYRVDPATGMWTHVQHVGDLTNPSFLALSRDQRFLYSVHGDGDYATAFMLNGETGHAQVAESGSHGRKQWCSSGRRPYRQVFDRSQLRERQCRGATHCGGWIGGGTQSVQSGMTS